MNMNEVLATLASERLGDAGPPQRPRQRVAVVERRVPVGHPPRRGASRSIVDLLPALEHLAKALRKKQREFTTVVKSGRTHLMDATPVTLGQEFGGYAAAGRGRRSSACETRCPRVGELPLGGTAVGTGINAPKTLRPRRDQAAGRATSGCRSPRRATTSRRRAPRDALVETSGELRTLAVSLVKIANDLRWMGSGPRTGLAEIRIPDLQPGSSIMPGKVNPVHRRGRHARWPRR